MNNESQFSKNNRAALVAAHRNEVKPKSQMVDPNSLINATGLHFNFENADRTWESKHGIVIPTIELQERDTGKMYDNGKWKAIVQHQKFLNQVSRMYVVYPNEEVIENTYTILKQDPSLKMIGEPRFTNHGLNMYITIVSEKHTMTINSLEQEKDDVVKLGVIIRNSIGGGLALGTDTFTYRTICLNGAVFGYEDLGSDSMRHYGKNTAKITELMRRTITNGLGHFENIHQYYDKLAQTKLGEKSKIFQKFLRRYTVPQRYYPDYVEIEKEVVPNTDPKEYEYVSYYGKEAAEYSLWKVFNDFTKNVWHSQDLRMDAKRQFTIRLHKEFIDTAYNKQET